MLKRICTSLLFTGLLLFSCTQSPTEYKPGVPAYRYDFRLTALHPDSLSISLTVQNRIPLSLPVHFFDNPVYTVSGPVIKDLRVTDSAGMEVDTICRPEKTGPIYNQIVEFPSDTKFPVTLNYRLNTDAFLSDTVKNYTPPVQFSDSLLFLPGAMCFIIPYSGNSLTDLWRTPRDIRLDFDSEVEIYGIPSKSFSCANIYELLFLQLMAGCPVVIEGHGGDVDFVFTDFLGIDYTATAASVSANFKRILDEISAHYGQFKGNRYTVAVQKIGGGLEASYGFSVTQPNLSIESRFHEILTHEALHNFIGIRCGEYDDPWWKEATATYLGVVLTLKLGLYSKDLFHQRITSVMHLPDSLPLFRTTALSNPWLRENMFAEGVHGLAYDKGSQVVMLLDLRVREASDNRFSINDVTSYLSKRFDNSAFHRQDFLDAFSNFGNVDVSDIFSVYVDSAGTEIPDTILNSTFNKLDSLKAFE